MTNSLNWKNIVVAASRALNMVDSETIDRVLSCLADEAVAQTDVILAENTKDLAQMDKSNPLYDRLLLTRERIDGIASDIRNVAALPSPLNKLITETERPNGMLIS